MVCDEFRFQCLREILFLKEKLSKIIFPREVKRFLVSRLSFALLADVFRNFSWRCDGICDSFQIRRNERSFWFGHSSDFSFGFRGVHLQAVKLKVDLFRDKSSILVLTLLLPSW